MLQTRLPIVNIPPEKRRLLDAKLKEIYQNAKNRFKEYGVFQEIMASDSSHFSSKDLKDEQIPEEFTKQYIINPILELLGYESVSQTSLLSPSGRRLPDYVIRPKGKVFPFFYVEAESVNTDLYCKAQGVSQVNEWLLSRASKTDYGLATDGLKWVLLKFDTVSAQSKVVLKVDLRPVFLKVLNPMSFVSVEEIKSIEEDLLNLDCEYVSSFLHGYLEIIEKQKEEISRSFYSDYVQYVFGYDKNGNMIKGVCLLDTLVKPSGVDSQDANLFVVVFMNRLIFLRFLEEKGIVPRNLLNDLLKNYQSSVIPATFYDTYLKPLFYEVLNRGKENRISSVKTSPIFSQIPYLNGGLFREVVDREREYSVGNEGIELVIDNLLEKYHFGVEDGIDPDILGYIFEKTINFISGTGTDQQKMKGAYYTPDDVVEFIIEETVTPVIFEKMVQGLKDSGWRTSDLREFISLNDLLDPNKIPKSQMDIKRMLESFQDIKILDPACGSGHFLTAVLSLLLRVKESLLRSIGEDVQRYKIKREIISQNLFGVDIDENAVEIARLRLWLSIIEEVEDSEHVDTLPNIDFNVLVGNSLVGWLNESLSIHPLVGLLEDDYVKGTLDALEIFYGRQIADIRDLLAKMKIVDTIGAYKKLLMLYSLESGERAVKIRGVLEKVRSKLYEVMNNSFLAFVHDYSKFTKNNFEELGKELSKRVPFHWKIDFEWVLLDGGFDVIVGNPPYVEDRNCSPTDLRIIKCVLNANGQKKKQPLFYASKDCGNTHAYFIERSIKLLRKKGRFGFIVPISLVSTDRMGDIRKYIHENSAEVNYYNFDDRPGRIFSGLEHCRSTIVVTEKGDGIKNVITSKYHRWFTKNRPELFKNLQIAIWPVKNPLELVPKFGSKIEKRILKKLLQKSMGKRLGDFISINGDKLFYHNAPQYWVHAHTEISVPSVEYYECYKEDQKTPHKLQNVQISDQYKHLLIKSDHLAVVNGLLNSHIFYWWYVLWSDGRHLLLQQIETFPLDADNFPIALKEKLVALVNSLMNDYNKNANFKINERSGGYVIKIKEIIPKLSKDILDQIHDVFAEYFEFSEAENNYIKDFDLDFRM